VGRKKRPRFRYARVLTDAERTRVEDYLAKKYGVTLAR
jgi:hypothetical protein